MDSMTGALCRVFTFCHAAEARRIFILNVDVPFPCGFIKASNIVSKPLINLHLDYPYRRSPQLRLLFREKIPQARQLNDVFGRQGRADEVRLRRGVNFVQMTLRFAQLHELLDALV